MSVNILDKPATYDMVDDEMSYKFDYELDHFQKHSITSINKGENVLVTAHTGSGKTCVAIYAIANSLKKNKMIIYCSPIKTLSNQKYKEFKEIFEHDGKTVGLMTGDNKIQPNADCIIMTTEILRNALYSKSREQDDYISIDYTRLDCVIFDEIHYINDNSRGKVWEETLTLLDPSVLLVMLSATIENSFEFATWISTINNKTINLIPTRERVIPLNHYVFIGGNMFHILDNNDNFNRKIYDSALSEYKRKMLRGELNRIRQLNDIVLYMKNNNLFQALFFSFSRKKCEEYARSINIDLVTPQEKIQIERLFNKYMGKYDNLYKQLFQYTEIKRLLLSGICYHHSGLVPIFKEIIEIIFQEGLVKVLFATETFAVGVNMPTKTVVFTELQKYDDAYGAMRNLETSEYKQMSGRAGRRGLDEYGTIILLPISNILYDDNLVLTKIMTGALPIIKSKFKIDISYVLKIIYKLDIRGSISEIADKIEESTRSLLYTTDNNKVLQSYSTELSIIEHKISSCAYDISNDELFNEYYRLYNISDQLKGFSKNIKIKGNAKNTNTLNNKMKSEIWKKIKDSRLEKDYSRYLENIKYAHEIEEVSKDIEYTKGKVRNDILLSLDILVKENYLNALLDNHITVKGIIASQVNEYNPLIITEIVCQNILNHLTEVEIGTVLAIFIGESHYDEDSGNIKIKNNIVRDTINTIEDICRRYTEYHCILYESWGIRYDYVNIVELWLNMNNLENTISGEIYVGNFVKSMLKLSNLIKDMVFLCTISGNMEIIPKLEGVNSLIVRDVVTVNSLYL